MFPKPSGESEGFYPVFSKTTAAELEFQPCSGQVSKPILIVCNIA